MFGDGSSAEGSGLGGAGEDVEEDGGREVLADALILPPDPADFGDAWFSFVDSRWSSAMARLGICRLQAACGSGQVTTGHCSRQKDEVNRLVLHVQGKIVDDYGGDLPISGGRRHYVWAAWG